MSGIIVELDVPVPVRDGTMLRADVYRPEEGPSPGLLMRTPYGKASMPALLTVLEPVRAAREGFAVVVQDARGRFASSGTFRPFDEGDDGHDAVEWLAGQPWCDGRVGMFGSSYMAAAQLQAAVTGPPALRAISPIEASADYYEGRSYRGGAFELGSLVTIALWALSRGSLERSGRERYRAGMREVRAFLADLRAHLADRPLDLLGQGILGEVAPFFLEWAEHNVPGEFWAEHSIAGRYGDIDVPALHITSWFDQFHVGTLANYEALSSLGLADQALVVGPWSHYVPRSLLLGAVRVGDVDFGLDALVDLEALQLRWFRRHVADDEHAWRQRTPVRLFVMGDDRWRDEASWPLTDTEVRPLHLAAGRRLAWSSPPTGGVDRYVFDPRDPTPTVGGAHLVLESTCPAGPVDHRWLAPRSDVLVYTSDPLAEDVEIVGWVDALLRIRSSAPSTDFTVKVLEVWPDGRVLNVVDGITRVPSADQPDTDGWVAVTVELGATAIVVRAGHALQVRVSSSSFPRFDVNPNTGEHPFHATTTVRARQEVCVGGDRGSVVRLPVRAARGVAA